MQNLDRIVHHELTEKVTKGIFMIISIPFIAYVLNLGLLTMYNLGQYSGTFLRNLYEFVC